MRCLEKTNQDFNKLNRRNFLRRFTSVSVAFVCLWKFSRYSPLARVEASATASELPKTVKIVEFTDSGKKLSTITVERISKTEAEWQAELSPDSFAITRHAGTERPYTNENPNNHAKGVFRCICCNTALFNADTKFDSGTGWPSFWQPIAKENVLEMKDTSLGMIRISVSCKLCDAHLGHVFDDGPRPTGLRYCMNSLAMRFAKAT
jgi:peptide-methionine (R)-S-oxide reductase